MREKDFLVRSHFRGTYGVVQRKIESFCCLPQRIAMLRIRGRQHRYGSGEVAQDLREERIVEVHANGLALLGLARPVEAQRNSCPIEMRVETRGMLESSDIELVGIFKRDFGFVRDGLGHGMLAFSSPLRLDRSSRGFASRPNPVMAKMLKPA